MQIIKKLFLSVLLVSTLFSSCGGTFIPVTGTYVNQLNFLDYMMKSTLTQYDIPGGSIAVVKNGKLVYARGFGYADRDNHVPVQPSDVFRIASVTKTITGMAATKLIQDGTLNLDDTVFGPNGILNDAIYLQINDQRVYDIKVKHLLSHTSGWYGETGDDPQYDFVDIAVALGVAPPASNVNVIEYVLSQGELQFAPGTQYLYSNVGYNMLGRIIEKVSGMTYEEYVRSILADPLIGVSDMYIAGNFAADRRSNEVYYYDMPWCIDDAYDGSGEQLPCSYGTLNFPTLDSHGGWVASPTDLLRMVTAIDGFESRPNIFTQDTINMMKQKPDVEGAHAYNSWGIDSSDNWSHSGALSTGTAAYLYRGEDEIEIAMIFNRLPGSQDDFWNDIMAFFGELGEIKNQLSTVSSWPEHDLF